MPDLSAIIDLSASEILAIPEDAPERLFREPDKVKPVYHALARRWHPDHARRSDVFLRIGALHEAAKRRILAGIWRVPGLLEIGGKRIRYQKQVPFELGELYISRGFVTYVLRAEFTDLARNAVSRMEGFRFRDNRMQQSVGLRLPILRSHFATAEHRVLVIEKPEPLIRLADLLDHMEGRLDPRHVAWMVSELLNLACYGEWLGLTHNHLSPETIYVDPARHSAHLLGGWWYATAVGHRFAALPTRTVEHAPAALLADRTAATALDLELIRLTGRELLGDAGGSRLPFDPEVPRPLSDWLRLPAGADAIADYKAWNSVLMASFGPRRFVEWPITARDIYREQED